MKRLLSSIIFVLMACSSVFSQSAQNGIVKEYNDAKKKTPLAGVEIVVNNAGSNVSAKNGKFVLSFRTLKPGDKVEVRKIEKAGYEIFNKDALDAWRIANDGSEFTIVLCKSAKFKALKDQYNAVASKSYAQQQKKDEQRLAGLLKEGKLQQAEYEKKLKELKDRYDEQLENLDNYIDRFARIDLETISKEEQKIIEMVKEGRIEEAIAAYEAMNLEEKYAQAVENIATANTAIEQLEKIKVDNERARNEAFETVIRMNNIRRIQGGEENFRKIGESLRTLADQDTTFYLAVKQYAIFAHEQHLFDDAIRYYTICFNCKNESKLEKVSVARDLGAVLHDSKAFDKAREWYLYCADLCKTDTVQFTYEYANINTNLSNLYSELNDLKTAKKHASYALELYKKVSPTDTVLYYKNIARAYNALGRSHTELNELEYAEKYTKEAIKCYDSLSISDSLSFLPDLALYYHNLGYIYSKSGKMAEALETYEYVVKLRERLVRLNPERYLSDLSLSYLNTGAIYYSLKEMDKAESFFQNAYKAFVKLKETYPTAYLHYLSYATGNLGGLYCETSQYEKAELYLFKSLNYKQELYSLNNNANAWSLAISFFNIGNLYNYQKKKELCIKYIVEALKLVDDVYDLNPSVYRDPYVTWSLIAAENAMNIEYYAQAINLLNNALGKNSTNQTLYYRLATCYLSTNDLEKLKENLNMLEELDNDFLKNNQNSNLVKELVRRGIVNKP